MNLPPILSNLALQKSLNLSDVANAATALANLGGFSATGGTIAGATTVTANFTVTGGNVGIGTTSPGTLLDVAGTITAGGTVVGWEAITGNLGDTSGTGLFLYYNLGDYSAILSYDWDTSVHKGFQFDALYEAFASNGTEVMRVTDGNVGIGTITPNTTLSVNGTIGISNSSAATVGVGVIAAKFPIYDASGTLLGYVPIYSSIT